MPRGGYEVGTADLSPAEWRIMNIVWQQRRPITVREVHDAARNDIDWAYTTVKTMMDRLVDKGVLKAERSGKSAAYRSVLSQGRAQRSAAKSLVERAFDGAVGPLVHELMKSEELTDQERAELQQMLQRLGNKDGDS